MKKTLLLAGAIFLLTGCATYKFQRGNPPHDEGYVVSRADYVIPEYTIGKDNSAPDIELAKERFNRRKVVVEDYYKKMGDIENRFKENVYDRGIMGLKLIGGVFAMPGRAVSEYKYEHDPEYREEIRKQEAENEALETARIDKLKEELKAYIQQDLAKEESQNKKSE